MFQKATLSLKGIKHQCVYVYVSDSFRAITLDHIPSFPILLVLVMNIHSLVESPLLHHGMQRRVKINK